MSKTVLQQTLEAAPYEGNQSHFAKAIETSQQNVSNWYRSGKELPAEYVLRAEQVTGIPRHVWRPDIYPPMESQAA